MFSAVALVSAECQFLRPSERIRCTPLLDGQQRLTQALRNNVCLAQSVLAPAALDQSCDRADDGSGAAGEQLAAAATANAIEDLVQGYPPLVSRVAETACQDEQRVARNPREDGSVELRRMQLAVQYGKDVHP